MKIATILTISLALTLIGTLSFQTAYAGPPLSEGDLIPGASFNSGINAVGMAFDGQFLYVPNGITSSTLKVFDTNGVAQPDLALSCTVGNLSWEETGNVFWGYTIIPGTVGSAATSIPVYTIDPNTGNCNLEFDAVNALNNNGACGSFCHWPPDGIDYDERDNTLRLSPDSSTIIYNLNLDGTFNSSFGPISTAVECPNQGDFSSGIATGFSNVLYSATANCDEVFKWNKDTGAKLGSFQIASSRNEALECDNVSFQNLGVDAIWVKDLTGLIQAFAVPIGTCNPIAVGGSILSIDSSALLVAGINANQFSIIGMFTLVAVAAFGALYFRSKNYSI